MNPELHAMLNEPMRRDRSRASGSPPTHECSAGHTNASDDSAVTASAPHRYTLRANGTNA